MSTALTQLREQLPSLHDAAGKASYVGRRLFISFKKAAWIAATTTLVLFVPLIVEMDREQSSIELEREQMNVLTSAAAAGAIKA